jgi:hypothetical protein
MESSLLQLFTPEEILDRLGQKRCTGSFHVFTTRDSANIFFKEGVVVAAACGAVEGTEVLKQVLQWKYAHYSWQPDAIAPANAFKPLQIPIHDYLAGQRSTAEAGAKATQTAEHLPVFKTISSKGVSTDRLPSANKTDAPPPGASQPMPSTATPVEHTATKNFNLTAQAHSAHDNELLAKYKLALVSVDNRSQRYKITRISGLIGRNPACDIPISHASISRQHCLLQIQDRGLHVKDLGTTNGTKVNGIALKEGYVNVGDKLTIGHLTFVVEKDA